LGASELSSQWSLPLFGSSWLLWISCVEDVKPDLVARILTCGPALVRAIEALGTIQPSGPFERALARLLMAAYKCRLRGIVKLAPAWVSEEILSASEHIGDDRAALWTRKN
jgi:hypothetical protein